MTDAISENGGVVDKFMGDGVMAYWGPPFTDKDEHATLACRAALQALLHLEDFRKDVHLTSGSDAEDLDLDMRIGVSSGDMIVGTIGSKASMNFTVMGDPVNLGSRLEEANKIYDSRILISERTRELADDAVLTRELDLIRVKGKLQPVRVYELLGNAPEGSLFAEALAAYRRQDWDHADALFRQLSDDPAAHAYLQRVAHLRTASLATDWDGVWMFDTK